MSANSPSERKTTMPTPFGPQLIGETEKTLNALLRRHLDESGLTEPQWVTLRLADALEGTVDEHGLAASVADRAHFADASNLVAELTDRTLLANGSLTASGRQLMTRVQEAIAHETAPIFDGIPDDDIEAASRVLYTVLSRGRGVLATYEGERNG